MAKTSADSADGLRRGRQLQGRGAPALCVSTVGDHFLSNSASEAARRRAGGAGGVAAPRAVNLLIVFGIQLSAGLMSRRKRRAAPDGRG